MERDMSFFENVIQADAAFGELAGRLPIFYFDNTAITAIFYAKTSVLKRFLPKPSYHPTTVMPGVGAIAITCFEYRDTDIEPYNEVSISIPMIYGRRPVPMLDMLSGLSKDEYHIYVHRLPVTTQIALDGGVVVYNYPKFMSTIDFEYTDTEVAVTLKENDELILKLTGKKIPAETDKLIRYVTYPVKGGCAQHADVLLHAKKYGQSVKPSSATLELGEHTISHELRQAIIWQKPMMYQYIPEFESILYAPSRLE